VENHRGWPVDELAANQELVEALLRDHHPDGEGRCCGCHVIAPQRAPWPCTLHRLATAARRLRNGRRS